MDDGARAALVIAASELGRRLLTRLLASRYAKIRVCESSREAKLAFDGAPEFDLAVADLDADPGVLPLIRALHEHHPSVPLLLLAGSTSRFPQWGKSSAGAVAVLEKPLTPLALFQTLRRFEETRFGSAAPRAVLSTGEISVEVLDPECGEALVRWEVRDISRSGALLFTHCPLVLGERLRLRILVRNDAFEVDTEVVRVQEPRWGVLPGVAVRFVASETARTGWTGWLRARARGVGEGASRGE